MMWIVAGGARNIVYLSETLPHVANLQVVGQHETKNLNETASIKS